MLAFMDGTPLKTNDMTAIDGRVFDVVIIGGGIVGANSAILTGQRSIIPASTSKRCRC